MNKDTDKKKKNPLEKGKSSHRITVGTFSTGAVMPRSRRFVGIARQMMRGVSRREYTPEQFETFSEKFGTSILWVDANMPSVIAGRKISIGVLGAIGKGVVWYGEEKMKRFCTSLGKQDFNGVGDPAHLLWLWLTGRAKYDAETAYRKTVAAIRAFTLGKNLKRIRDGHAEVGTFAAAESDLFEWDSDFVTMLRQYSNGSLESVRTYDPDVMPSEEEIKEAEELQEKLREERKPKKKEQIADLRRAKCPRCKGQEYDNEGKYYRCKSCNLLVNAVGRPVEEEIEEAFNSLRG